MVYLCPDWLEPPENKSFLSRIISIFPKSKLIVEKSEKEVYRRLIGLESAEDYFPEILAKILDEVPNGCKNLGIKPFQPESIDLDISHYGTNHYCHLHSDRELVEHEGRKLTFEYYCFYEPKHFAGGVLKFGNSNTFIEPANNLLVIFPSSAAYEITPVQSNHRNHPKYNRISLNGWIS